MSDRILRLGRYEIISPRSKGYHHFINKTAEFLMALGVIIPFKHTYTDTQTHTEADRQTDTHTYVYF